MKNVDWVKFVVRFSNEERNMTRKEERKHIKSEVTDDLKEVFLTISKDFDLLRGTHACSLAFENKTK